MLQTLETMQEEKEDSTAALREFAVPGIIIDSQSKFDGNVSRDFMKLREISPHHFSFFELTSVSLE